MAHIFRKFLIGDIIGIENLDDVWMYSLQVSEVITNFEENPLKVIGPLKIVDKYYIAAAERGIEYVVRAAKAHRDIANIGGEIVYTSFKSGFDPELKEYLISILANPKATEEITSDDVLYIQGRN